MKYETKYIFLFCIVFLLVLTFVSAYNADSYLGINSTLGHSVYSPNPYFNVNSTLDDDSSVAGVVDTIFPNITFVNPTIVNDTNTTIYGIWANVTAYDDINISYLNITLFRGTTLINSSNATSPNFINFSMDNQPDGNYTFNATARDIYGNQNSTETRIVRIDRQAPNLGFASPTPNNGSYRGYSIFINASFNDSTSGINEVNISIFNSTFHMINSTLGRNTGSFGTNFSNLVDGRYYFNVTINDFALNRNITITHNVSLDNVAPNVAFVAPTNVAETNTTIYGIWANVTASDNIEMTLINITLFRGINLINSTSNSISPLYINFSMDNQEDGNYSLNATARDTVGNQNVTETRIVRIDRQAPNVAFGTSTPSNGTYNGNSVFIEAVFSDPTSGIDFVNISIYNSTDIVSSSQRRNATLLAVNFTNLIEGVYYFNISATDFTGLKNITITRNVTLDNTFPNISFVAPTLTNATNQSLTFIYANVTAFDNFKINSITIWISRAGTVVNSSSSSTSPLFVNFTVNTDGNYTLGANVSDGLGVNNTENRTIIVDTIAPNIGFSSPTPANGTSSTLSLYINISANDTGSGISIINISLHNATNNYINSTIARNNETHFINFSNLVDGTYYVNATAEDYAGNRNSTHFRNYTIDSILPNITFENPTPANNTLLYASNFTANVSVVDTNFANVTIWLFNNDRILVNNSGNSSVTPFAYTFNNLVTQQYYLNATAWDSFGQTGTSETRNITVGANFTISLDGFVGERKYEYGTNVSFNISSSISGVVCLYIDGKNQSCGASPFFFNYTIYPVIKKTFNNSELSFTINVTAGRAQNNIIRVNFSTEMDFLNFSFIINTTSVGVRDIEIIVNNVTHDNLLGLINQTVLVMDKFSGNKDNVTLFFRQPGSLIVNINMSVRNVLNGSFSFSSQLANSEALNFEFNFTNSSFVNTTASNGSYPTFIYENFDTIRNELWNFQGGENNTIDTIDRKLKVAASCSNSEGYGNTKIMNITRFNQIKYRVVVQRNCNVQSGSASYHSGTYLTSDDSGSPSEIVATLTQDYCGSVSSTIERNVTLTNLGSKSWNYQDETQNIIVSYNTQYTDLKILNTMSCSGVVGGASIETRVYDINVSGFGNEKVSSTTYRESFNYTSGILLNSSSDIVSATMSIAEVDEEDSTAIFQLFLSNNGNNFESVQQNQLHTFLNTGSKLYARVFANTSNTSAVIGISQIKVDVNSQFPRNISIDIGQDGIENHHVDGIINSSNQTYQFNINSSFVINSYLFSGNCTGKICLLPITFTSATAGILIIKNLSINQYLGNISLNRTSIEDVCTSINCTILINFTTNTTGPLTAKHLEVMYRGDANLSVGITTTMNNTININSSFLVRYSKFNILSPVPYFVFFPQTNNSKYVQPFGQNNRTNISIFNITNTASTDPITIWMRFNQSLNSCLVLYTSNQTSLNTITHVNTTYQMYLKNISVQNTSQLYFWLNLTQCNPNSIAIQDPWSFLESSCESCVQTWVR